MAKYPLSGVMAESTGQEQDVDVYPAYVIPLVMRFRDYHKHIVKK